MIKNEEKVLEEGLDGYKEYMQKVRYKVIHLGNNFVIQCLSMALIDVLFCFFVPCCYLCGERLTAIFVYERRHFTTSVLCG